MSSSPVHSPGQDDAAPATAKLAVFGEAMLEISGFAPGSDDTASQVSLSYGGDTLNTAVYMAHRGVRADYVSALGDDSASRWMLEQWRADGVGCDQVELLPGKLPGMYMIQVDEHGEYTFSYWRENSAARFFFNDSAHLQSMLTKLRTYPWVYFSGISLALLGDASLSAVLAFLQEYKQAGGKVIFDGNYRPRLWPDIEQARRAYAAVYSLTDIALPTLQDELSLFGGEGQDDVVSRLRSHNIKEIALKMGAEGCLLVNAEDVCLSTTKPLNSVDSTAAGDAFNAAYLAARLSDEAPAEAAAAGHKLAAMVIQHRGAIVPRDKRAA